MKNQQERGSLKASTCVTPMSRRRWVSSNFTSYKWCKWSSIQTEFLRELSHRRIYVSWSFSATCWQNSYSFSLIESRRHFFSYHSNSHVFYIFLLIILIPAKDQTRPRRETLLIIIHRWRQSGGQETFQYLYVPEGFISCGQKERARKVCDPWIHTKPSGTSRGSKADRK